MGTREGLQALRHEHPVWVWVWRRAIDVAALFRVPRAEELRGVVREALSYPQCSECRQPRGDDCRHFAAK